MSSVDNRIVNMQFNNKQFQSGATDSVRSLEELEATIEGMSGSGGLEDLGSSVDQVASRFGFLQIAGISALATIASQATSTALDLGKNLLGSITSTIFGAGQARAIAIEQAKFQFRGLGLDVEKTMESALIAVKGTSFGLQEAATAAAQFGGAGIKSGEQMTGALRSISGIAAQTGRSYTEIAQVMTGIAGVGKVTSQDLIQFGVRGLNVAAAMAEQLGVTETEIREMVSNGEISFQEFSVMMDKAFGENATKANRTFTGSLANVKAALSRIGASIADPRLKILQQIFVTLAPIIDKIHEALLPTIKAFSDFQTAAGEGLIGLLESINITDFAKDIIRTFRHIVRPFIAIFDTIGDAWSQVFPDDGKNAGNAINNVANAFRVLTIPLRWLAEAIPKITPLFVAFFSALKVGWAIVEGLYQTLSNLGPTILNQAKEIGSNLTGGLLEGLSTNDISAAIVDFANNIIDTIKNVLGIHSPAETMVEVGVNIVEGIVKGIVNTIGWLLGNLGDFAVAIINGFKDMFGQMDAQDVMALINAALVGGILLAIRQVIKTVGGFADALGKIGNTLTAPFDLMTESLKVMQTQVKAELIKSIAIAVGILTASIIALSLLDPKKVAVGLGFLASELALITGVMFALSKFVTGGNLVAAGAAILLISNAMLILSTALAVLGNLDTATLAKGLTAMAIALGIMVAALFVLGKGPLTVGLASAGAAMVLIASAMTIMAAAVALLGNMDMGTLAKGLVAMGIGLALFTAALYLLGNVGPLVAAAGAGIYITASAMVVMAGAIAILGNMDLGTLAKGLIAMGVGLGLMTAALFVLTALGPGVLAAAAGIFVMSSAMLVMATALGVIGDLSIAQIATALVAVALGFALLLAAGYAAVGLAPGLLVLGTTVLLLGAGLALAGAGMLAFATAFAIFAAVGTAGISVLIAGFTAFITLLPQLAQQLAISVVTFIETIAAMAPRLREAFGKIIREALRTVRDAIPEMRKLANALIGALLSVVRHNIPDFQKTLKKLIRAGLDTLVSMHKELLNAGIEIITNLLNGVKRNVDDFIDIGTKIIKKVIKGIGDSSTRILRTTVDTLIEFAHDLADTIESRADEFGDAGWEIAWAIVQGLADALGTDEAFNLIRDAAIKLADSLPWWMRKVLEMASPSKVAIRIGENFVDGFVIGIQDSILRAVGVAIALANAVIAAGDKVVAKAQNKARKEQIAAAKKQARAELSDRLAREAERAARQSPNNKALQKAAKEARKIADAQQKAADDAQRRADAAAQRVQDVQAFRDADKQGKGDILTDRAEELADRAIKKLAEANAAAEAAKKASGKERERLQREAKQAARDADRLAKASKAAQQRARQLFAEAVKDRIESIREERKAEEQARREQEEFDAASDDEKIKILQARSEAAEKRAAAQQKQAQALLKQARKLAKKDADRAQKLLDKSEQLAQRAEDSANEARDTAEQAESIRNQGSTGGTPSLEISNTALEDAASSIDRFTKSLQLAEELAQATAPVYQFYQTNQSPAALSEAEIYRQSKNLLSAAEIKMAETSN